MGELGTNKDGERESTVNGGEHIAIEEPRSSRDKHVKSEKIGSPRKSHL
jgi:hypothetical protein